MSPIFITAIVLLFVTVVLGFEGAYEWWTSRYGAHARRIDARIEALAAGGDARKEALSILKSHMLSDKSLVGWLLLKMPGIRSIEAWLLQSGTGWSVGRLIATCAALPLAVLFGSLFVPLGWPALVAIAVVVALLPVLYVRHCRARRLLRFEQQLPEACDMLARALRSGHAFSGAIDLVGTEFAEPMGGEFRITFDEINYGVPLNEALAGLARRMPVRDLRYFVIAVLIQRETGGNLAELLDGIASLVRERFKLYDKVRVLAAEGKMSAWVLGLLPVGAAALISVSNPGFLAVLWQDPSGIRLSEVALSAMAFGVLWIRRIVRIRV